MDNSVFVGAEQRILRMYGDGPNDLGQGNFSPLTALSLNADLLPDVQPFSINKGTLLATKTGIMLLSRDGAMGEFGLPWQNHFDADGYSPVCFGAIDNEELLFILTTKVATGAKRLLVYQGQFDVYHIWAPFESQTTKMPVWAGSRDGALLLLDKDGIITTYGGETGALKFRETAGGLSSTINLTVQTGFVPMNSPETYKRLWWVELVGRGPAGQPVTIVLTNDDPGIASAQTAAFTLPSPAAGSPGTFILRTKPVNQKARAYKIQITCVPTYATGMSLKMLNFRFGVLPTRGRPAASTL
jgi:hypothetical protein